jgi:Golgi nucleoside diphosphatase
MSEQTQQIDAMALEKGDVIQHKETGKLWEVLTWTEFEGFLDDDPFRDYELQLVNWETGDTVSSNKLNEIFQPVDEDQH